PIVSRVDGPIAALTIGTTNGGTNWPGAGYDPELHTAFLPASNSSVTPIGLIEPPAGFSDIRYVSGQAGQPFRISEGPGYGSAADYPQPAARGRGPGSPGSPDASTAAAGRGGRGGEGGAPPA